MANQVGFYFSNYAEWRHAITVNCKIELTPEYAQNRINALNDDTDKTTQEFTHKYGESYLNQVIQWFEQAKKEG